MKKFADLHLQPNLDNKEGLEKIIYKTSDLGYNLIGVSLPSKARQAKIDFLQKTCRNLDVDLAKRVDLAPKSARELLKSLRQFRRKFELVAVRCFSKSVARQAAKDHRVDLLVFPSTNPRERFFDRAEANLASQGVAALEIDMVLLLDSSGFSRARFLSCLRREVEIAEKFDVPVVICSGAAVDFQLRGPRDFVSLATLFGMDNVAALKAVSVAPLAIIRRSRRKLDSGYVARGVRVVRRGKNCGD
jgi:ribonuclease P/MRP protein subunit RPP1